ncbi:hypothetical protein HZB60_06385 [candidate division KSB1 bacterium]|nr:hypothetical protein [candidate division KSB1 bacterium]
MRSVILITLTFCLTLGAQASALPVGDYGASVAKARVLSESSRDLVVEFTFDALTVDTVWRPDQLWISSSIAGATKTTQPGWPELPQKAIWINLLSSEATLEIIELDSSIQRLGIPQPAPFPQYRDDPGSPHRVATPEYYASSETYPATIAELTCTGSAGSAALGLLTFHPVRCAGRSGDWFVYSRIRVRVSTSEPRLDQATAPSWSRASYVQPAVLNPRDPGNDITPTGPRMLVVTERDLLSALEPWLQWKRESGIAAHTIIYSEVAATAVGLRNYLVQYVDTLASIPEFLTIVGDVDRIPAHYGVGGSLTDHLYSNLSGNDYLPDWSVGRIPCTGSITCASWVARQLSYERDGVTGSPPRATVFSSAAALDPQHGIDVRNLLQQSGLVVNHLQEPQTGTLPLLTGALDLSPNLVFYIGHGHAEAWSSVHPDFVGNDLPDLIPQTSANVIAVACATADLDYPGGSLAEQWLNQPQEFAPISYFGATESTAFFYSDTLGIGMLRAIFAEHLDRLGYAADYGRLMTAASFPQAPGGLTEETIQQFCLLGDPSMRFYSEAPAVLELSAPATIPFSTPQLTLTAARDGVPALDAEICVTSEPPGYYAVRRTGHAGQATFELNLHGPRTLRWTATARNSRPARGVIQAIPASGAYLTALPLTVADSTGDADGVPDRGEQGTLRVALTNIGSQSSPAASLDLHSRAPRLWITPADVDVPAIAPHDTLELETGYAFAIADTARDGASALIDLTLHHPQDSVLIATQSLWIRAADLYFLSTEIREDSGDGDANPEAGERLSLGLKWQNRGGDAARQIVAQLQTSSPGIDLLNTSASAAGCQSGDTVVLTFTMRTNAGLPRGIAVNLTYAVQAENHPLTQGATAVTIGRIPVFLYVLDRSPENVEAVSDALSSLGVEHEQGAQLPSDLALYTSIWIFSGIFPNQAPIPWASATRLTDYLDHGGCCYWEGGDVWAFDQQTPLHARFHIDGGQDGTSDAGPISGEYGTVYDVYDFAYGGENNFIDQLSAGVGAQVLLRNARAGHEYPVAISFADPRYRTIGSSIELGGLVDAEYPTTRVRLLNDFLRWFRIQSRADVYAPEISHIPPRSPQPEFSTLRLSADIQDVSGVALAQLQFHWNAEAWQSVSMPRVGGRHRALLVARNPGDVLTYKIVAEDSSIYENRGQTPEYQVVISADDGIALNIEFDRIARPDLASRMSVAEGGGWCLIADELGSRSLELNAQGRTTSFDTWLFSARKLRNAEIMVPSYLRAQAGDSARILGSVDGGRTFSVVVWSTAASPWSSSREGMIWVGDQRWLCGSDSVVLRFEYQGNWYWRIGNIRVSGETAPRTQPVKHLVIQPTGKRMGLFWEQTSGALYYIIRAANRAGDLTTYLPVAMVKDTSYIDEETSKYEARFYQVDAVTKPGRPSTSGLDEQALREASLRVPDLIWTEKRNRRSE